MCYTLSFIFLVSIYMIATCPELQYSGKTVGWERLASHPRGIQASVFILNICILAIIILLLIMS